LYDHTGTQPSPNASTLVTPARAAAQATQLINDGLVAERHGRISRAFADYQAAARKNPNNAYAPFDLGTVYQQRGDEAAAVAEYQKALSIDPSFADALYNLGVLEATTDPSKAISYYEMDLRLQPNNAPGNFNLGVLLIRKGQRSLGYTYLDKALHLKPSLRSDIPPDIKLPPASGGS
jgi:tetratricopeptide (TPR) repeat protein